ncbi:helix-turn-helix domain-containing protein [Streptomyces sp. NBC_00878]|uniref:helix-turn-helix domain-containing protein n=1 Tax=Streptomyces sp. NBC_00878 TaxID=2975854 RepID=UPI002257BD43|nr:helix-turn-helix domain-containing protein [Streptomyces sp. NBC_00878]MCX4908974.1 helix-turn-helix domain-containing protein [Streptomyces sp. NBC_00878]
MPVLPDSKRGGPLLPAVARGCRTARRQGWQNSSVRDYIFCCEESAPYPITSVDHALHLATLLQQEGPLRVSDAAERLGVSPSTAHRLLAMLVYRGFAEQRPDRSPRNARRSARGNRDNRRLGSLPHGPVRTAAGKGGP